MNRMTEYVNRKERHAIESYDLDKAVEYAIRHMVRYNAYRAAQNQADRDSLTAAQDGWRVWQEMREAALGLA